LSSIKIYDSKFILYRSPTHFVVEQHLIGSKKIYFLMTINFGTPPMDNGQINGNLDFKDCFSPVAIVCFG
jgi:hypothetical protein